MNSYSAEIEAQDSISVGIPPIFTPRNPAQEQLSGSVEITIPRVFYWLKVLGHLNMYSLREICGLSPEAGFGRPPTRPTFRLNDLTDLID